MAQCTNTLGQFEELILLATIKLGERAYGATIRRTLEEARGRAVSIGAVYAALDRLECKGYVKSWQGEATAERGGRSKRYFRVEGSGQIALAESETARKKLLRLKEASSM